MSQQMKPKTCKTCNENNTMELAELNHCVYCHKSYFVYIDHLSACEPFKLKWAETGHPPIKPRKRQRDY